MLIFNTTYHIENERVDDFIRFIIKSYIPKATFSRFLHDPRFTRIFPQHEEPGSSYSLQFRVKDQETLNYWLRTEGELLEEDIRIKFNDKVIGFITILEEINID